MSNPSFQDSVKPIAEHEYYYQEGSVIADRYRVINPLGFGGFSEVYHCEDMELFRSVAVKLLLKGDAGLKEARTAAHLKHVHIVEVYDIDKADDGRPIIIFQYIEGETLEQRLAGAQFRCLPLNATTLRLVRQLAEAIDYAHQHTVIHRDIKPSNVILDKEGNAYLTDFGLAEIKLPNEKSMMSEDIQQRLSGTIPYMAPEQLKEGLLGDAHSDLYSLGVVVYEMLTGRFPYPGREATLVVQIATAQPQPPTLANPELPKGIEPVLLAALNKDPQQRPPTCAAFAQALEEASQAYVAAESKYKQAQEAYETHDWRKALAAFEALQASTPDFKDVNTWLEKSRQQVRLLELSERAQQQVNQGAYQDALITLGFLSQLDPGYDVTDLHRQAQAGQEQLNQRSLADLYKQAVNQYETGNYEACVVTLDTIYSRQTGYPDSQDIEAKARAGAELQRRWRELYNQGVAHAESEQWALAVQDFQQLKQEEPRYRDVETRLTTARHMARLSGMLAEAQALLAQGDYTACVDKLRDLQQIDEAYKQDEVNNLRATALKRLREKALQLIQAGQFVEAVTVLDELKPRNIDLNDIPDLYAQAEAGITAQSLQAKLDGLYQQAVGQLRRHGYQAALDTWNSIQQQKEALDVPDPQDVENRAREGLANNFYNQALAALAQGDLPLVMKCWQQVLEVSPDFPDTQQVVQQAQVLQQKLAEEQRRKVEEERLQREKEIGDREKRRKLMRLILIFGSGLTAMILLVVVVRGFLSPVPLSGTPTVTLTQSVLPTTTPLPVPTTAVPPSTPTQPPADTPTPATPTPPGVGSVAAALQPSTIYALPSINSAELAYVQPGEQVTVSGRSDNAGWFYVRNNNGAEGYVAKDRFQWTGNPDQLPVVASPGTGGAISPGSTPAIPRPPNPTAPKEGLTLDLWSLPWTGRCRKDGTWTMSIFMSGHGASGIYTYYWNNERKGGPMSTDFTFIITGTSSQQGVGRVVSSDGRQLEQSLRVSRPACQ
jgi:serine/threonine protein kinase